MSLPSRNSGFTLLELMIAVAIVGILAAFAYPSYVEQIRKSKRSDAQIVLQQLAQRQEAYFVRNYQYATTLTQLGYGAGVTSLDSPQREYDASISAATNSSYTLQAVADSSSGQVADRQCTTFSLDNLGRKTAVDNANADTSTVCWR